MNPAAGVAMRASRHHPRYAMGNYSSGDGMGQVTGQDVANAATLIAGLISNPDATLASRGPAIVNAVENRLVGPLMQQTIRDYVVPYFGPPLVILYVLSGMAMWSSYTVLQEFRGGKVKANPGRRRRRRRRS